jgi:tetratricopeptide (TPR) repeat protein/predicted aspartyl protease
MRCSILAAAALAVGLPPQAASAAACQFQQLAQVPVTMQGLRATVRAKINGHDTTLMIDSGAFFSTISTQAAADFAMAPTAAPFGLRIRGVGGGERDAKAVRAAEFNFAGAPFKNADFLVADRVGGGGIDGLIGENILGSLELEYDLANGMIRFFKAKDCSLDANLAYWSAGKALSVLPLVTEPDRSAGSIERTSAARPFLKSLITTAKVDGHSIKVTFDSGTPLSVLSRPAAARAGVKPSSEGVTPAGVTFGIYGGGMQTYIAPFDSFAIGGEEVLHTRLRVADIELGDSDMLLGADFFLSHRVLVSNSQHRLYFTYNGGPVFRLDQAAEKQTAQAAPAQPAGPGAGTPAPAATAAAAPSGELLKTASDYARRASAEAARREFAAAVADYTMAIELDPKDASSHLARASARAELREGAAALADLDQALKLKPDDVRALLLHGEAYLNRDPVRAEADFAQAMKLAPGDRTLPLTIAEAYLHQENFARAVPLLDTWISSHAKDEDRPRVVIELCGARALWGQDNPRALADCDAALKVGGKTISVLASRGLVLLRLGRLEDAVSQFDAALKVEPKEPWALYGRGLAKTRKGDKAGGEADIAAALAVRSNLAQAARRYGIATEAEAPPPSKAPAPAANS